MRDGRARRGADSVVAAAGPRRDGRSPGASDRAARAPHHHAFVDADGEYNDNIYLDNRNRKSDFITGFTPGIAITVERPTYRLSAGYNYTAELFARETSESHAFDRQNFWLDSKWRIDPTLTVSVTDALIYSFDTNLIAREGVSTGRNRSFGNALGAGLAWQFDPLWTLRSGASWTLERFSGQGRGQDSDVYRVNVGVDRRISSVLTVGAGYELGYFDVQHEEKVTTHTPRIGAIVRATDTITLALSGGPTVEHFASGRTRITPAVTASYAQRMPFGSVGLAYDRSVGTAGGLGGPTDNDLISGYVTVTTLMRGLAIQLLPRYSIVQSPSNTRDRVDVRAFTAALAATYRFTDWFSLIGGYQFFHQRSDSSSSTVSTAVTTFGLPIANNADQNRVFFGLQFGYPIRID
jgi:hypothetical protein